MENESLGGGNISDGVVADNNAADSSPESSQQVVDPIRNVKAEMNRKFSKIDDKISQLLLAVGRSQANAPVEKTEQFIDENAPDYKRYVDARFSEAQVETVKRGQESAWSQALEMFPELNQDSEKFDEKFYKMADRYYGAFDLSKDADAPIKAVKLAALELGKIEQLTREKLLRDESRRSRIISEGGNSPRENKQEKKLQLNRSGLAKIGVKADELEAFIKANKDRYGDI